MRSPAPGRPILVAAAACLLLGGAAAPARAGWGDDVEDGAGPELIEWVRSDLAAIVRAPVAERPALVERFAKESAADAIEAVKRFRNPELRPLFHALLDHGDWHVVHRALLALERLDDETAFPRAWALLEHPEARLREKAAITCLRLWERAGRGVRKDAAARLDALRAREQEPCVRACLDALASRAAGTLRVEKVSDEVRVTGADGLVLTPFLHRMATAKEVAPEFVARYVERNGEGSAADLPPATRWTFPLLDYGREDLPPRMRLQPFGHPRNGGRTRHTGVDVGAFLDGAGLYACAQGVVKLVYTGSDMGTEIVVEHHAGPSLSPDGLATVVYMHAADVVFVAAGDRVEAGQLLASMGLGHSFENGGHFAHLHLGMYRGPFRDGHNYGYEPASWDLADWLDPTATLRDLVARSAPPPAVAKPAAPR